MSTKPPTIGHTFDNGTVWAILGTEGQLVAKAMSDTEAKRIICERMDCDWEYAHRLGFRAVVVAERYTLVGILQEKP